MAESAERRAGRNGSSQQAKHGPDTEPDFPRHRRLRDTAVPKGCRHDRSEEPGALAGTPGSARGASGNRRPTATVQRYHPLGYRRPLGTHLRYFLLDRHERKLGCLLFDFATRKLACRDAWIGWAGEAHRQQLQLVVRNARFLLFPWVRVENLASKTLGLAVRQLPQDWQREHGYRPVLVETFVDPERHKATCNRAANWQCLGQTQARGARGGVEAKTPKQVYVQPLHRDWQAILRQGPRAAAKAAKPRPRALPQAVADDGFVSLWQGIVGTLVRVAGEHDRQWLRRQRALNTLLC